MTTIRLNSVSKSYGNGDLAVSNLSLDVADGEFMVLLGPSGCGKTTVLRMIAGLEPLTTGQIWFGSINGTTLPARDRGVAMVFQNGALYPNRTVKDNITFPLLVAGDTVQEANAKATGLARVLSIESTLDRMPQTLSGGQRQRVAIGRAIVRQPKVFLMDEPLSNLDATMRTELRQEIGAMTRDMKVTTVYVTHDQVEALTLADRIAVMRNGQIEDVGAPTQIFGDPATAFVAAFLGTPRINLMSATVRVTSSHRVHLDFGHQTVTLPALDRRSMILRHHHGIQVIVGARSDAFTPTTDSGLANQLSGTLRALEFHGNQWVAFVECGIEMINPDRVGITTHHTATARSTDRATSHHDRQRRRHADRAPSLTTRARALLRRSAGRSTELEPVPPSTHRRADLVVEVGPDSGFAPHSPIRLDVDTSRLHIFDENGHRVDRVIR